MFGARLDHHQGILGSTTKYFSSKFNGKVDENRREPLHKELCTTGDYSARTFKSVICSEVVVYLQFGRSKTQKATSRNIKQYHPLTENTYKVSR